MGILLFQILPVLVLLTLGYLVGTVFRERQHFKSLVRRETRYRGFPISNLKVVPDPATVENAALVSGDAVIATDYFKSFAAGLRTIVGGEMRTFESLMNRARREAKLRMLDQARRMKATEVWNVRYETSNIRSAGGTGKGVSVEVFAFGTAIRRSAVP